MEQKELYIVQSNHPNPVIENIYHFFSKLKRNAGQKSILFMGRAHQLADFYKLNSGFAVAAVTITDRGPQYRYANREGIPDFFREIVERRYAEMKAKTTSP